MVLFVCLSIADTQRDQRMVYFLGSRDLVSCEHIFPTRLSWVFPCVLIHRQCLLPGFFRWLWPEIRSESPQQVSWACRMRSHVFNIKIYENMCFRIVLWVNNGTMLSTCIETNHALRRPRSPCRNKSQPSTGSQIIWSHAARGAVIQPCWEHPVVWPLGNFK